jgi:EmrB/QacA subfamily drug resistance transporter
MNAAPVAPQETDSRQKTRVVSLIVGGALFMQMLDTTVITTALPAIARDLHQNPVSLNITITAYLLSLAVFIPVSGWVADRFGAKEVFRAAIAIFVIGSVFCGLSNTLTQLVLARILQGFGGSMMMPVGRVLVLKSVPKSFLIQAMSYLTIPGLLGPMLGPPVGGFVVTYLPWEWIFFINAPIGIVGVVMVTKFIPHVRPEERRPLDWAGFILSGTGFALVVFGFEVLGRGVFPPLTVAGFLVGGVVSLGLFAWHAGRVDHPIVDLSVLGIPTYRAATIGGGLMRMPMGASPFLMAMLLQVCFGLTPLQAGSITFIGAAGALTMKFVAPPILRSFGFRHVLIWNAVIASVTVALPALFLPTTPHLVIMGVLLVSGFFRSLQMTGMNAMAYADISSSLMSRASGLASLAQQVWMSIGVGFAALVLHLTQDYRGHTELMQGDVAVAFLLSGVLALVSLAFFVTLPADAGAEVSSYVPSSDERNPRTTGASDV